MARRRGVCSGIALVLALVVVGGSRPAYGAEWWRPANCTEGCDAQHQCTSNICVEAFDACPGEHVETSREAKPDMSDCKENECAYGGCDEGWAEVSSKTCTNLARGCPLCKQETCCRVRPALRCCRRLNCTLDLADCEVPQQGALGLNSTSASSVYNTSISSGGKAQFPFYAHSNVSHGSSCDAERVWGVCACADGQAVPGCLVTDSSTWLRLGSSTENETLLAGLSLTCSVLPSGGGGGGGGLDPDGQQQTQKQAAGGGADSAGAGGGGTGGGLVGVRVDPGGAMVIHTTPVRLDEEEGASRPPVTPQPTGQPAPRAYRGMG